MMKRNNVFSAVFLLAVALLLTACGFHLRGSMGEANMPFKTIFVAFPDNSALTAELKRTIRSTGAEVVTDRAKAEVVLESLKEQKRKVVLSLNSQGRVREYSLFYLVQFQARDKNGVLILQPTDIELRRTLTFSEAEALAKETEEQMLYRDMQTDLVQQIIRRLTALKMQPAANTTAGANAPASSTTSATNK